MRKYAPGLYLLLVSLAFVSTGSVLETHALEIWFGMSGVVAWVGSLIVLAVEYFDDGW